MRRSALAALSFLATAALVMTVAAQPPGGPGGEKQDKKGKKGKEGKGPPRFAPGVLFPPGLREELNLTPEQEKSIAALEKDVKEKLEKLLTDDQKKTIEEFRPRPPMGGPGGPGGPGGGPGGPGGPPEDAPMPKQKNGNDTAARVDGGIQWFATLEAGLSEANRTGKPVLFLSAAPHCGGIPGMW